MHTRRHGEKEGREKTLVFTKRTSQTRRSLFTSPSTHTLALDQWACASQYEFLRAFRGSCMLEKKNSNAMIISWESHEYKVVVIFYRKRTDIRQKYIFYNNFSLRVLRLLNFWSLKRLAIFFREISDFTTQSVEIDEQEEKNLEKSFKLGWINKRVVRGGWSRLLE